MTHQEAIQILDQATQPANAGRITREGYWQAEEAVKLLRDLVKAGVPIVAGEPAVEPTEAK